MYGISNNDKEYIDKKIEFQKKYYERFMSEYKESGDFDPLDSVYSANLNPKKYFSEINNRVNTMVANAKDNGLKPVFLTITAPSKYHIKSAKHFCPYSKLAMADYGQGLEILSHNKTAKALTQIFNKFTRLNIFTKMKKDGYKVTYFRVYEPHKSGVPHLHCLFFLPVDKILPIKKKFYDYFSDSKKWNSNKKSIDYRYTWYSEKGGAVGYIMKYILKTFEDTNKESVQDAVYWYIKHRIRRFLSSRTLAPLTVYRKIRYYFKNLYENDLKAITKMLNNRQIQISEDGYYIWFHYEDEYGVQSDNIWSKSTELQIQAKNKIGDGRIHLKYTKKEIKQPEYVTTNGKPTHEFSKLHNKFVDIVKVPSKMTDYELINHYKKLEVIPLDKLNLQHFILTKNEMINRELLDGEIQSLNVDIF